MINFTIATLDASQINTLSLNPYRTRGVNISPLLHMALCPSCANQIYNGLKGCLLSGWILPASPVLLRYLVMVIEAEIRLVNFAV